jgi:hypothetical protein
VARGAKLKVYRTPIGFHDAYVAAPSQKAALEAWGSNANLFARGVAEVVTDPKLTKDPLAHPGEVIRKLRGSASEQIAALPPDRPARKAAPIAGAPKEKARTTPKPLPRPSRADLDAAEQALEQAQARHREEDRELSRREAELARQRRRLGKAHDQERSRIEDARKKAEASYLAAIRTWRG